MAYNIGKGTVLQVDISSVMTTVPQAVSITPPQMEHGTVEVTHMGSTARENQKTIPDPGEASFRLEWDPSNTVHQQLETYFNAGTTVDWEITMSDAGAAVIAFSGHIQNFGLEELTVDNVSVIPVTIKITGMPTITP